MASIRKRGNSYLLVVSMGYTPDGRRRNPQQKTVKPPTGLVTGAGNVVRDELQEDESSHRPVDHAGKVHGNLAAKACSANTKLSARQKRSVTTGASRPKMTMCSAEKA